MVTTVLQQQAADYISVVVASNFLVFYGLCMLSNLMFFGGCSERSDNSMYPCVFVQQSFGCSWLLLVYICLFICCMNVFNIFKIFAV